MTPLKREDCWMTFTEALEQYLNSREEMQNSVHGSRSWVSAQEHLEQAKVHLDVLTDFAR